MVPGIGCLEEKPLSGGFLRIGKMWDSIRNLMLFLNGAGHKKDSERLSSPYTHTVLKERGSASCQGRMVQETRKFILLGFLSLET